MNKRIRSIILVLIMLVTALLTTSQTVSAATHSIELVETALWSSGERIAQKSDGSKLWRYTAVYNIMKVNGQEVFCIEPHLGASTTGGYTQSDFNQSEQTIFSRIIYHGYDSNPSELNYVVTQNVLHDYIDSIRDDLTIIKNNWKIHETKNGKVVDYEAKKAQIMAKVNSHETTASFDRQTHSLKVGESITLTDTNGILSQAKLINNGGLKVGVSGNKVTFTALKAGSTKVEFKKFADITEDTAVTPILYSHPTKQDVITGGRPDPIFIHLNFNIEEAQKGQIILEKVGEQLNGWQEVEKEGYIVNEPVFTEGSLKGSEFDLTNAGQLVNHYVVNEVALTTEELDLGNYQLEETKAPLGYVKLKEPIEVSLTIDDPNIKLTQERVSILNEKQTFRINFKKEFQESIGNDYHTKALQETFFGLYTKEDLVIGEHSLPVDTLVDVSGLDEEGNVSLTTAMAGEYYVKELKTHNAYQLDETRYDVTLSYNEDKGSVIEVTLEPITNQLRGIKVVVNKKSAKGNTPLNGALFEVRDSFTQEVIGKYLTGGIYLETEPNNTVDIYDYNTSGHYLTTTADSEGIVEEYLPEGIYSYIVQETAEEGIIEVLGGSFSIDNLVYGQELELRELRAPVGYQIDPEPYKVIVESDDYLVNTITVERTNYPLVVETGVQDRQILIVSTFGGSFICLFYELYLRRKLK